MNKLKLSAIVLAISLAYGVNDVSKPVKTEYKAAEKPSRPNTNRQRACGSFADNAKDICMAEAKGKEKVANAELDARYKPSRKATYKFSVTKAEADYAIAKEKRDDKSGNVKDVCVKEPKAALVRAKADAKAQLKTSKANATANETSSEAQMKAKEKGSEARKDAAADKRDADFAVAKEKCDALAGNAKESCMNQAKTQYGK